MALERQDAPKVSIIIPYYNCRELTEACVKSIVDCSGRVSREIILIDDAGSEQPDLSGLAGDIPIRTFRNDTRKSYSTNNNRGAKEAKGELLCLLNNDTFVTPGWLDNMVAVMESTDRVGVLANCHLYPDSGKIQHAGMGFDKEGFPLHLNPGMPPDTPSALYQRQFQCVTFACVMIAKKVYDELGGLDESYQNGFEDVDFCLRSRQAGYGVWYTPASKIYHYGQATEGRTEKDEENWQQFLSRWNNRYEWDLETLGEQDRIHNEKAARRTSNRPSAEKGLHLNVDFTKANAFTWATVDLMGALRRRGVSLSIPMSTKLDDSIERHHQNMLRACMSAQPRSTYHVKWTHYWPDYYRKPLFGDINAEFFCTNYRYRMEGRKLDLWMRHVQVNEFRKIPVSGFNRDALLEIGIPEKACQTVPLGYSTEIDALYPDADALAGKNNNDELQMLMVTNSHDLYRYGTDIAIKALGRAYSERDPVVLHIKDYGAGASDAQLKKWIAEQPQFPRIVWHREFLSKQDLIRLYASMDIQLAPFRGEGFAMKILDAAAVGVPTLMPAFGGPMEFARSGMFFDLPYDEVPVKNCYDYNHYFLGEGAYWCQPREDSLTEQLTSILDRRDEVIETGQRALEQVRSNFSWDAAAGRLMKTLEDWHDDRFVEISKRNYPDTVDLSVIIPTKDRVDVLGQTLNAYRQQTIDPRTYEIVIVNDHGDLEAVQREASRHSMLNVRVLDNCGQGGPAAARNLAIQQAAGKIILITGDDIEPRKDFLSTHIRGHDRFPQEDTAFVGLTLWHPDLPETVFMEHITGSGGQQFKYNDMSHDAVVPFDRLYTSNCSLKRSFVIREEVLFSTRYRYAAYEDIEFGYRLHLRGMVLRHLENAIGFHNHLMTPHSFLERQRKVGRMLTLLSLQRPCFVPNEHTAFLRALELYRCNPALHNAPTLQQTDPERFIQDVTRIFDNALQLSPILSKDTGRACVDEEGDIWKEWLHNGSGHIWESVNQAILRQGMAEEWAEGQLDPAACAWIQTLMMPNITAFKGIDWNMPFTQTELPTYLFPNSRLAYWFTSSLRSSRFMGKLFLKFEHSAMGQKLRDMLATLKNS